MIEKIKRQSLSEEVYGRLKQSILKEYKEGSLIPSENKLCVAFNVSRVVLRKALKRLREERFIVTRHGKGSFVANPVNFMDYKKEEITKLDYNSFKEIMEFRSLIECSAVSQAVLNATEDDIKELKLAVSKMLDCAGDVDEFNRADYEFHLCVLKCSHNQTYIKAMEGVKADVMACLDAMNKVNGSRDWALDLHPKIADCIEKKDGKGAIDLLKNSGEYNMARMKELVFKG